MYAVFSDGGHQHAVEVGDVIAIDLRDGLDKGASVSFEDVMVVRDGDNVQIGTPHVDGAKVDAEVVDPLFKGKKLIVQKFRRRKADSKKAMGHRQKYTKIRITNISAG